MRGTKNEVRPGVWRLRVFVGTNEKGHPVQKCRTVRGSAKAADAELRKLVDAVEKGRHGKNITLAELLDEWLRDLGALQRATQETIRKYRYTIDAAIVPSLGRIRIDRLTPRHLEEQYAAWLAAGLSRGTVLKRHRIIAAALAQAVRWGWIDRAVTKQARPPSAPKPNPRKMKTEEIRALIAAAEPDDPILATAIALAAATGARRGELCSLRWSDYDPVTGLLQIWGSKTEQARVISLDPFGMSVLADRIQYQEQLAMDAAVDLAPNPWFLSRRADGNAPCQPGGLSHAFMRLRNRLGLPYHFHELRHWVASEALANGHDPRNVAGRLGHSNPAITMRVYAKFMPSADQRIAESVGRALAPPT